MLNKLVGYHGTTFEAAQSILNRGFKLKGSDEDWLGSGAYFFVDGISEPVSCAYQWALNQHKKNIAIIQVEVLVNSNDLLDLTTTSGLNIYNQFRNKLIQDHGHSLANRRNLKIKKRRDIRLDDCLITNLVQSETKHSALIHNVYIKNKSQRQLVLESSYPNSTVLCINDLSLINKIDIYKRAPDKIAV